jgi:hypothetical protein
MTRSFHRPMLIALASLLPFQTLVFAQAGAMPVDPSAAPDQQAVYDQVHDDQAGSEVGQANLIAQMILQQAEPEESVFSLAEQLQSNPAWVNAFNTLFSATLPVTGPVIGEDIIKLLDIEGDPKFNAAAFLKALVPTRDLYVSIKSQGMRITAFNHLFNAQITASSPLSGEDRKMLFGVTGDPGYKPQIFLAALPRAHALASAIEANADRRGDFNLMFGTTLRASGPIMTADLKKLFAVAGDPDYSQTRFLKALDPAASLLRSIRADASRRADFNLLYGTRLSGSGVPSGADAADLFAVAAAPGFNLKTYLPVLEKTADLLRALRASPAKRAAFNREMKTSIGASGPLTVRDLTKLFAVAGTPGYKQADLLKHLSK